MFTLTDLAVSYGDKIKYNGKQSKIIHVERDWRKKPPTICWIEVKYADGLKSRIFECDFVNLSDYSTD